MCPVAAWITVLGANSADQIPERRGKQTEAGVQPEAPGSSQDDFALHVEKTGESDELSCFQTQLSKDSDNWQTSRPRRTEKGGCEVWI